MYKNLDVISSLNEISFYKLEKVKCGEALSTFLLFNDMDRYHFKGALHLLLSILCSYQTKITSQGNGECVFCFTPSYANRDDYRSDIHDVAECTGNYVLFETVKGRKIHLNRLFQIPLIIKWVRQMKKVGMPRNGKIYCAEYMFLGYTYSKEIKKELKNREIAPKIVTTFCDVHVCDYFLTNVFNEMDIDTATLQHGIFSSISNKYANLYSRSKYFLGLSEYAKREFIKSGRNANNFRVLGSMKYIKNQPNENATKKELKIFGVALSGIQFECDNQKLIHLGRLVSQKYDYRVLVRLHPALSSEKYRPLIESNNGTIDYSKGVKEFADKCDFVIVGKSTVFSELISECTATFRLYDESDVYDGINCLKFSCWEELRDLVDSYINDYEELQKKICAVRSILCAHGIIADNYRNFYKEFV